MCVRKCPETQSNCLMGRVKSTSIPSRFGSEGFSEEEPESAARLPLWLYEPYLEGRGT